MEKVLVFGGAFDPPHKEHARIAFAAAKYIGAKKIVVVPTYSPPHKEGSYLTFDMRAELVRKAFSSEEFDIVVDDIERQRGEDNYAALILPVLKQKYGDIAYLIGGDSLDYFEDWYMPQKIADTCAIFVAPRQSASHRDEEEETLKKAARIKEKFGADITVLPICGREISSSQLRAALFLGERAEDMIGEEEYACVQKYGLFDEYKEAIEKLKTFESEELFLHSKAVVKMAVELNGAFRMKLPFRQVFTAALLHDNAKQRPSLDGLEVPIDAVGTPVLHQFLGAEKARRDFGVDDEEVLDAIRFHTTAKADMTLLERLIYTADSVSGDRDYEPIPALREIVRRDFEEGFRAVLAHTYEKLADRGRPIYPLTVEAYEYYILGKK